MSKAKARAKKLEEIKPGIKLFYSDNKGNYSEFSQLSTVSPFVLKLTDDNGHKKKGIQIRFSCCEQYMVYQKAILFKDYNIANQILNNSNPSLMKAFDKKIGIRHNNLDEDLWDKEKFKIVIDGNYLKFSQNVNLKSILLSTGDSLIAEANPTESIWGIGIGEMHPNALVPELWPKTGMNLLGKALMEVRYMLLKEKDPKNEKIHRIAYPGDPINGDPINQTNNNLQEIKRQNIINKLSQSFKVNQDDI